MGLYLRFLDDSEAESIRLERSPLLIGRHPRADVLIDSRTAPAEAKLRSMALAAIMCEKSAD